MSIRGYIAAIFKQSVIAVDEQLLLSLIQKYDCKPWFFYGQLKSRKNYWNTLHASYFLAKKLNADASILETGCGPALNLIWFFQKGFKNLQGIDIDEKAIAVGRDLLISMQIDIPLYLDDFVRPNKSLPINKLDAIMALNWVYLDPTFDLHLFLNYCSSKLNKGGYIVIDLVDSSYNFVANNQYLTSDWSKPVAERKTSEYKLRFSSKEVYSIANKNHFIVLEQKAKRGDIIPKNLYIMKKN